MNSVNLKLRCGHFTLVNGNDLTADDPSLPFLVYTENGTGNIVCSPDKGIAYNARITLPDNIPESFELKASDISMIADKIVAGTAMLELKSSSVCIDSISARRINLSVSTGSSDIHAAPSVSLDVDCGKGTVNLYLKRSPRGYFYNIAHGAGSVTINSIVVPRSHTCGSQNGTRINIRCGLGKVNVFEY